MQKALLGKLAGPFWSHSLRRVDFDKFGILHSDLPEDLGTTVQDPQFGKPERREAFGLDLSGTGGARYSKSTRSDFGRGKWISQNFIITMSDQVYKLYNMFVSLLFYCSLPVGLIYWGPSPGYLNGSRFQFRGAVLK